MNTKVFYFSDLRDHKALIGVSQVDLASLMTRKAKLEMLLRRCLDVLNDKDCIPDNAVSLADIGDTGMCNWNSFVAHVRELSEDQQ